MKNERAIGYKNTVERPIQASNPPIGVNLEELYRQTKEGIHPPGWKVYAKYQMPEDGVTFLKEYSHDGKVAVIKTKEGHLSESQYNREYGKKYLGETYLQTGYVNHFYRAYISDMQVVANSPDGKSIAMGNESLAYEFKKLSERINPPMSEWENTSWNGTKVSEQERKRLAEISLKQKLEAKEKESIPVKPPVVNQYIPGRPVQSEPQDLWEGRAGYTKTKLPTGDKKYDSKDSALDKSVGEEAVTQEYVNTRLEELERRLTDNFREAIATLGVYIISSVNKDTAGSDVSDELEPETHMDIPEVAEKEVDVSGELQLTLDCEVERIASEKAAEVLRQSKPEEVRRETLVSDMSKLFGSGIESSEYRQNLRRMIRIGRRRKKTNKHLESFESSDVRIKIIPAEVDKKPTVESSKNNLPKRNAKGQFVGPDGLTKKEREILTGKKVANENVVKKANSDSKVIRSENKELDQRKSSESVYQLNKGWYIKFPRMLREREELLAEISFLIDIFNPDEFTLGELETEIKAVIKKHKKNYTKKDLGYVKLIPPGL